MSVGITGFTRRQLASGLLVLLTLSGPAGAVVIAESESNNTAGTADSADPGTDRLSLVSGTISSATDVDFYSFPLALGERIWVATDTGGGQGAGATSRDTVIDLIGPDGSTVIETDDDDGTGTGGDASTETETTSVIAGRAAAAAGTYYVRVQGKSGGIVSPYKLVVATSIDADDVGETETNDAIGVQANGPDAGQFTGAITTGEADTFEVQVMPIAGQLLFVALDADVGFDAKVELVDSGGTTLIAANSSTTGSAGSPPGESFTYFVPAVGNRFVRITAADGVSTGGYRVLSAKSTEATFADLSVDVTDSADPVTTNGALTYTVTVTNQSQIVDASSVDVTFTPSGGSVVSATGTNWNCTTGPIACSYVPATLAKDTMANPITVVMTAPAVAASLQVTAAVSGSQADDSPLNDSATEATQVNAPASGGGGGGAMDLSLLLAVLACRLRRRAASCGTPPG